ncbi:hypothetical protein [Sphingopyxis sp. 550A]
MMMTGVIPHERRVIVGTEPCEVVYCGRSLEGFRLYDVWCNEIGDYLATVPPFPTTNKERAEATAKHCNEQSAKRAISKATSRQPEGER